MMSTQGVCAGEGAARPGDGENEDWVGDVVE